MSSPEQKLKRFLHYGKEEPVYQPGSRYDNDAYHPRELESIDALIASEKYSDAIACIVKAFSDGYSAHPEMLVYALAICVRQKTSVQLTAAAYKALKTVCVTPENLFLFVKFAAKLSPSSSVWGNGFRNVLKEWYLKKNPKTLAEIVARKKSYYGWRHSDLLKLAHIKSNDPGGFFLLEHEKKQRIWFLCGLSYVKSTSRFTNQGNYIRNLSVIECIIKYVLHGIGVAKKEFGDQPGTSEILEYIQSIEDFKRMTDEQQAVRTVESLHLTLDYIPCHLLKNREIWNALIGNLPLGVLINNLERIGSMGFLKPNSPMVSKVLDALHDERSIAESHLHPAQVFLAMKRYVTSSKFVAAENAQKRRKTENGSEEARKVVKVPPKPNIRIVVALNELFASTCKLFLAPTGLRYMVAINPKTVSNSRSSEKCYRCPYVTPQEATVVTTLCLLHADQKVSVRASGRHDSFVPIPLTPAMTVPKGIEQLNECLLSNASSGNMSLAKVLESATSNNEEYDVIVFITDHINKRDNSNIGKSFNQYRKELNLPNAKLITLSLTCHVEPTCAVSADDPRMFDIAGFDGNVPRIIEAFSRGAF